MPLPECDESENVIRAIRSSDWDEKNNRWSSNLFIGPLTSVSRIEVLPIKEIFKIFHKELHKPPVHKVIHAGEINVGKIKGFGREFKNNGVADERTITVTIDPIKDHPKYADNPAHALIEEKLPRRIAFDIIKSLTLHNAPNYSLKKYRNIYVAIAQAGL